MFSNHAELVDAMRRQGRVAADPLLQPLADARCQQTRHLRALAGPLPDFAGAVQDVRLQGPVGPFVVRLLHPTPERLETPLLLVRGGGWWSGTLESHEGTARSLANRTRRPVCMIDYHHAPEARYPAQRDEILIALAWMRTAPARALGLAQRGPVLVGESAGATLCLTAVQRLRDLGEAMPSGLVLFYPNSSGPAPGARRYSRWVWQQYLGQDAVAANHPAIPIRQSMQGLCPAWIGVGEDDPLVSDAVTLDQRLRDAGVDSRCIRYPGLPHGFVSACNTVVTAQQAFLEGCEAAVRFALREPPCARADQP